MDYMSEIMDYMSRIMDYMAIHNHTHHNLFTTVNLNQLIKNTDNTRSITIAEQSDISKDGMV